MYLDLKGATPLQPLWQPPAAPTPQPTELKELIAGAQAELLPMLDDLDPWNFYLSGLREAFSALLARKVLGAGEFSAAVTYIGTVFIKYVKDNPNLLAGNPDFDEVGLRKFRNCYLQWQERFKTLSDAGAESLVADELSGLDLHLSRGED